MKKYYFFAATLLLFFSCATIEDEYYERLPKPSTGGEINEPDPIVRGQWDSTARLSTDNLIATFWREHSGNWYFDYGDGNNNHYWPQAHAMDVVIDAYLRNVDYEDAAAAQTYLDMFPLWFEGVRRGGNWYSTGAGGNWRNPYIDDMAWIVLTQIRMYEATQVDSYLTRAKQIYNDWIISEWDEVYCGGGVWWYVGSDNPRNSKNACINGPACLIAGKLCALTDPGAEKDRYKAEAVKIHDWMWNGGLVIQADGRVYDAMNKSGQISNTWISTYNQGTYLGACQQLYKITGEQKYLDRAIQAADYSVGNMVYATGTIGVLKPEGTGDNELFRGILIRYLVRLANDADVPNSKRQSYHAFMITNATCAWTIGASDQVNPFYSQDWGMKPSGQPMLNRNISACTLLEGINALEPIE